MKGRRFELNEDTLSIIEEIGGHMPGGFFICRADEPGALIYANKAVFDIYGCDSLEAFKHLTGYTFRGMVHPDESRGCRWIPDCQCVPPFGKGKDNFREEDISISSSP